MELRKRVPKDFVGWVYLYVTKAKEKWRVGHQVFFNDELYISNKDNTYKYGSSIELMGNTLPYTKDNFLNGKVVARFWFDEYEELITQKDYISGIPNTAYYTNKLNSRELLEKLHISKVDILNYLLYNKKGYAWHIKNLELFDTPKELSEFYYYKGYTQKELLEYNHALLPKSCVTKAPQSYQYVEIIERLKSEK
jgi:predicted transcriptional regulator